LLAKSADEAWYLLKQTGWDLFEFEKASRGFPDPIAFYARSYYALFGVTCAILLTMILIYVLIMHAMLNLTLHHPWITLMLS